MLDDDCFDDDNNSNSDVEQKIMVKILQPLNLKNSGEIISLTPGSVIIYEKIVADMLVRENIARIIKTVEYS